MYADVYDQVSPGGISCELSIVTESSIAMMTKTKKKKKKKSLRRANSGDIMLHVHIYCCRYTQ